MIVTLLEKNHVSFSWFLEFIHKFLCFISYSQKNTCHGVTFKKGLTSGAFLWILWKLQNTPRLPLLNLNLQDKIFRFYSQHFGFTWSENSFLFYWKFSERFEKFPRETFATEFSSNKVAKRLLQTEALLKLKISIDNFRVFFCNFWTSNLWSTLEQT